LAPAKAGAQGRDRINVARQPRAARIASALARSSDAGLRLAHRRLSAADETEARLGVSQGGRPWRKNPTAVSMFMFDGAWYYVMNRGTAGPVVSYTDEQRQRAPLG